MNSFLIGISTWISPEVSSPGQGALWESRPRFLSGTSLQRCHRSWPDVPMTSLAEAFGLGRGCFGREGVLRCTGTFPETGGPQGIKPTPWTPAQIFTHSRVLSKIKPLLGAHMKDLIRDKTRQHYPAMNRKGPSFG